MSTRSTLTIKTDTTTINFYRHMDGYVAEAGNTIAQLLNKVLNAKNAWQHPGVKLAEEIMKQQYEATEYRTASPIYELTNNPILHGDIEYHYDINFNHYTNENWVHVYQWIDTKKQSNVDHNYWNLLFTGNFEQYKNFVAKELAEHQKRIKAYEEKLKFTGYHGIYPNKRKRPITVTGRRPQKV